MIAKTVFVFTLLLIAACSTKKTPIEAEPEAMKLRKDSFTVALSRQLEIVNFKNELVYDGSQIRIRVINSTPEEARRAICQEGGWPTANGRKVRLDLNMRRLRESGFTRVIITSGAAESKVELAEDGKCLPTR
jgi:hypothetical protein